MKTLEIKMEKARAGSAYDDPVYRYSILLPSGRTLYFADLDVSAAYDAREAAQDGAERLGEYQTMLEELQKSEIQQTK